MRVLHLLKTSVGATWALRQMRELVRLGIDVHVALPPGPLTDHYRRAGVGVHEAQFDFSLLRPHHNLDRLKHLRRLVKEVSPDLIHSHFVGTTLTARLALGRNHPIPRIFQVPGPLHLESRFFRQLDLMLAGPADHWIGACQWTQTRYIHSGVDPSRVFLSYYPADVECFRDPMPGALRQELGLAHNARIIGMVAFMYAPKRLLGQTRGLKGHEDLIDAIAICRRSDPNIHCVFVGGAWDNADAYERRVKAYGTLVCPDGIAFLGTRMDVNRLYPDFDVAVHPSLSENVGGAVESLLMSIPTVATNVGGFPDLVIDGETGWLTPPRNPQRLAETILTVLANPTRARAMAMSGQILARRMFDVRDIAPGLIDIYSRILAISHRPDAARTILHGVHT